MIKLGKHSFDVDLVRVDPEKIKICEVAEAVHSISMDSLGHSPGTLFFQKFIASKRNLCLLAQHDKTPIAAALGTYLELPTVNFFHFNFLGRKVEFPSIHIIEKFHGDLECIRKQFPKVHYLTLCVQKKNEHSIAAYQAIGFEELEYIENGYKDEPMYFYGKKIDSTLSVKPPTHNQYKHAVGKKDS